LKPRILYIVPHRFNRSPGQRFRCEHFIPILQNEGFDITYANLLSEWDDIHFYKKNAYPQKLLILIKGFFKRLYHSIQARNYDIIFIYREAFMIGTTLFERILHIWGKPIIYDFDDSIWLNDTSDGNKHLAWLKNTKKTNTIVSLSHTVIVGNSYLAQYAKQFNNNVVIIPTTIDTKYHKPSQTNKHSDSICIGWTGTETTQKHYETIIPALENLYSIFGNSISFRVISNNTITHPILPIQNISWNANTEIEDLQAIDIGIMPLPNDEWSKGKCGFKGLQYMALEIPSILSPVGVNSEIITHGINGYLASTQAEWEHYLTILIQDAALRKRIGIAGRKTIENYYSIESQKQRYISIFRNLLPK